MPEPLSPFDPRPLIAEVDRALEELLSELPAESWERPAVKKWRVRHVVAHLLDGNLRRLSLDRDGWSVPDVPPIAGFADLTAWLDGLNAEWTTAAERLSPALLLELSRWANLEVQRFFDGLELDADAGFPVAWAAEERSAVWMDLARELTEKWLHQQQIRDAVERPGLTGERFVAPVLDTFARALPRSYGRVEAPPGTRVAIETTDLASCRWLLVREDEAWSLYRTPAAAEADARVRLDADTAWRLFVKGISAEKARTRATATGPRELTGPFFATVAIMG